MLSALEIPHTVKYVLGAASSGSVDNGSSVVEIRHVGSLTQMAHDLSRTNMAALSTTSATVCAGLVCVALAGSALTGCSVAIALGARAVAIVAMAGAVVGAARDVALLVRRSIRARFSRDAQSASTIRGRCPLFHAANE
jgi:hypothetical protein